MVVFLCSVEGDVEVVWDKSDVVHMDDAMAVPATGGFYKSVAHHFYEVYTCTYAGCPYAALQTLIPSQSLSPGCVALLHVVFSDSCMHVLLCGPSLSLACW